MELNSRIYVAGHKGMVGSAIVRRLIKLGYSNTIIADKNRLNLLNQLDTQSFFDDEKPEYVFLAAAKVGGIKANSEQKADFIYQNSKLNYRRLVVPSMLFPGIDLNVKEYFA